MADVICIITGNNLLKKLQLGLSRLKHIKCEDHNFKSSNTWVTLAFKLRKVMFIYLPLNKDPAASWNNCCSKQFKLLKTNNEMTGSLTKHWVQNLVTLMKYIPPEAL